MKNNTTALLLQGYGQVETVTLRRWTKVAGPQLDGWRVVEFADGHRAIAHESGLRATGTLKPAQ